MTDRRGSTATGGTAVADQPGSVRNVALVGHSGSGKTTLVEALLTSTGAIPRAGRVEDGTSVSDFDEVEVRQQRSVNLTLAPVVHAGIKVNLLDTPGYADFTGDLRAGLRAADAALFTVPANRWPVGNSQSAPAAMPTAPVTVIAFGVTGVRASASTTGVSRRFSAGFSRFSMAVRSYWRVDRTGDSGWGLVIRWPAGKGWP